MNPDLEFMTEARRLSTALLKSISVRTEGLSEDEIGRSLPIQVTVGFEICRQLALLTEQLKRMSKKQDELLAHLKHGMTHVAIKSE